MPHNHPPRCCCPRVVTTNQRDTCPSCVEHGELAQLSKPHAIAYNPEDEDHDRYVTNWHQDDEDSAHETWLCTPDMCGQEPTPRPVSECPSCHTTEGRPHTDYCQLQTGGLITSQVARLGRDVTARAVRAHKRDHEVEAKGVRWHQTGPDDAHERYRCRPDLCGWDPITSQPNARTSQPPTQTRGRGIFTDIGHTVFGPGGTHVTHLRTLCRPDICGADPTPSQ